MYRNYFGKPNVEYADGTHRPEAQNWYDNAYKVAGLGGNCYGMSVSSLRLKNSALHTYWHGWFEDPANLQNYLWRDETRQTVQEDQGPWLTQEVLDAYAGLSSTQKPRDVYNRAASLVTEPVNRPVMVIWGKGWGHAIVPYATEVAGDEHRIILWENNHPYSETEACAQDPDKAIVRWGANTFP